jgi:hypothetical protein
MVMIQTETFEGGCACGQVRYRAESGPMYVHCCHCRDCQRQTGSAFALNALIETDRVSVLAGEPVGTVAETPSGGGQEIMRCPKCAVAVWSHYGPFKQLTFLRVGTLDDPGAMPPDIHIWTRSKQSWVRLPDGIAATPEYYDAKEFWPEESLKRRSALFR